MKNYEIPSMTITMFADAVRTAGEQEFNTVTESAIAVKGTDLINTDYIYKVSADMFEFK